MSRTAIATLALALAGCAGPLVRPPPESPPPAAAPPVEETPAPAVAVVPEPSPAVAEASPDASSDGELADDEADGAAGSMSPAASDPLLLLHDDELIKKYRAAPAAIGSISVGAPSAGLLVNGVQMPEGPNWVLQDPGRAWGTKETVDSLALCIDEVQRRFPGAPAIPIGHISARNGGHLSPHRSHQSGRDVDVGYYHRGNPPRGFISATADTLDAQKTWLLVKTALAKTSVDMIFIDSSLQRVLADFALQSGEDPKLVDDAFQVRNRNPRAPIRHVKGHGNHLHIRFHAPVAEALGARLARVLPKPDTTRVAASSGGGRPDMAPSSYQSIRARSGDTLVVWAKKYAVTVEDIQRANGLSGTALKIGVVYRIPVKGPAKPHGKGGV